MSRKVPPLFLPCCRLRRSAAIRLISFNGVMFMNNKLALLIIGGSFIAAAGAGAAAAVAYQV